MTVPTVSAAIYCLPSSGCGGALLPLPLYPSQFAALVLNGAKRVRERAFACFEIVARRNGLHCDLGGGYAVIPLEDWELAWDQLGIDIDAKFAARDAIAIHWMICNKIASGTIFRRQGKHGRKTNRSKDEGIKGDLDERCHLESIIHCRVDGETDYSAAKRALELTPFEILPRNLRQPMVEVKGDEGQRYKGRCTLRGVIKNNVLPNVRAIEKLRGDSRRG